jgi:hypothetical protein
MIAASLTIAETGRGLGLVFLGLRRGGVTVAT